MIQWYPGHMAKSMRSIEDNVKRVDLIVYVLDARAPESTRNPQFDRLAANRSCTRSTRPISPTLRRRQSSCGAYPAGEPASERLRLTPPRRALRRRWPRRRALSVRTSWKSARAKGVRATIRAMVIGVPNCGKSTLINNLAGKAKTVTGDRAGVTRGTQWVRVNDYFEVLDTPGTLYPKFTDERAAYNLAFIGSIRDEVLDTAELAQRLIETLNGISPGFSPPGYGAAVASSEDVARARGFLLKGGLPDGERAAAAVIDDFRKGRLGRITLDEPDA